MTSEESLVISALSVDEAIILGLTRLAATRDEVDIEVLDEGSRGFLGLGVREARVRLVRRPPDVLPDGAVVTTPGPEPVVVTEPEPPATPLLPEPSVDVVESEPDTVEAPVVVEPAPEPSPTPQPAHDQRARPSRGPERGSRRPEPRESKPEVADGLDRESIEQTALDVAQHLFPDMQIQVTTNWQREDRPTLWVSLRGKDADVLVGPRAQTLDAVQYLFRTLLHRLADGNYNVVVDADGYRRRRRRSLESQARKMADKAVQMGRTLRMRPMPAHERRVVHILLRKDKRVKTESTGRGRDRAITIIPVDADMIGADMIGADNIGADGGDIDRADTDV